MSVEHDYEPVRGLPRDLPPGETIVWQGEPDWILMAKRVFRVHWVALYFMALMAWRIVDGVSQGQILSNAIVTALWVAPIGLVGIAIFLGLAYLNSKTTVYTLTNRRVVMRFGAALTKAINIPYKIIESAALNAKSDGSGDLAIQLVKPNKISVILLWPHARPGHIAAPQPTFRCLRHAAEVAPILADCLRQAHAHDGAQDHVSVLDMGTPARPASQANTPKRNKTPCPALDVTASAF
ncbi:photosynthetic complex putative assembly protein PuhB [Candidatus Phycosocius spiralis]|uniref:Photosynthetic complex assembly protein n=1 Tax=Candidatus Phycosocius spiralis TaxID=2815099 RepID=A0ABQ4PUP5_9PROT|nr:photosynthetic complex putative assembly protein PuhB [Candidatus Phycosocius spiralis]GIU66717.1 photosynthetic complex assembly protein [Candidatus Phycosocius spiralis]